MGSRRIGYVSIQIRGRLALGSSAIANTDFELPSVWQTGVFDLLFAICYSEASFRRVSVALVSMLAVCETLHDLYSRVANTCRTHPRRYSRLFRWSRTN
jgi:hypothetical protein